MPDVCFSFVLLFAIFIIVLTQTLVLQQSKNVTAKCTETRSPPPSIQYLLGFPNGWNVTIGMEGKYRIPATTGGLDGRTV